MSHDDPHRRAKSALPPASLEGTDWRRHVLASLLGQGYAEELTGEQVEDQALWLVAWANLCAMRGAAPPEGLYSDLAERVDALGQLHDMLRDALVGPLWDEVNALRKSVGPR